MSWRKPQKKNERIPGRFCGGIDGRVFWEIFGGIPVKKNPASISAAILEGISDLIPEGLPVAVVEGIPGRLAGSRESPRRISLETCEGVSGKMPRNNFLRNSWDKLGQKLKKRWNFWINYDFE